MNIKLDTTLVGIEGTPLKDEKGNETNYGLVITNALLTPLQGDDKMEGKKKAELFNIWFDKIKDQDEAELTSEEVVVVKERIGMMYPPLIVGQMYKLLK